MDLRTCPLTAVMVAGLVGSAWPESLPAQDLQVKVMSFNIRLSKGQEGANSWASRRDLVCETIRRFDGDFCGIQEAWPDQVADLGAALPAYRCLVRSREADAGSGEATPLLYRHARWQLDAGQHGTFWLSGTPEVPGSRGWWNLLPRIVTWGRFTDKTTGRAVYVFNTHFSHLSEPARRRSAALLAERILQRKNSDPVIVTGDFNAGETSNPVRYLKGEVPESPIRLIDSFRAFHPDAGQAGTFNGFQVAKDSPKIDYVFTSPDVRVLDARIVGDRHDGRYASDHYPVTADLLFPASARR